MKAAELQILLVAGDSELIVNLAQELIIGLPANLTISDNIEQAQVLASSSAYDAIIACQRLKDGAGLSLLSDLTANDSDTPVILIDQRPDSQFILSALRLGAADVFDYPVDGPRLLAAVRNAAAKRRKHLKLISRTSRLRKHSARLVRDRRDLRKRVDLICRDIVTAYRRLAEKVATDLPSDPQRRLEIDADPF